MEQLYGGYTLRLCPGAFPLSTDSMVLAHFVKLQKNARVLDLGSGCGTLGLLLCARDPLCTVTGIELDENAHSTALENIRENALEGRMESICADMTAAEHPFSPGSFDCCVSNPPYFTGGPVSTTVPLARHGSRCTMGSLFAAAARAVRYGGDFYLVHRPERLAELCACAHNAGLEPKRLCLVRHDRNAPVSLLLVQCRKGGKPGLIWEELHLKHPDGTPTDEYRKIYHLE